VWCETLAYDEVVDPPLVAALRDRGVELLLAVRPWQLDEVGPRVQRLRDAGLFVGLWPMLDDADGRWASVESAAKFIAFADEVVRRAPSCDELVLDLEPPLAQLARWKDARLRWRLPSPATYRTAREAFVTAAARWRGERRVTTALMPMVVGEVGGEWLQWLIGTPASALPVERHSVMAYTSLFEGWSRGLVNRRRAEALLVACARLARARFGPRAALSLGCVGAGAFGDEPAYRDAAELARDVALARRAGIDELTVFDLGGMVRRGPVERWLDALA
jgi:hypothetical protein